MAAIASTREAQAAVHAERPEAICFQPILRDDQRIGWTYCPGPAPTAGCSPPAASAPYRPAAARPPNTTPAPPTARNRERARELRPRLLEQPRHHRSPDPSTTGDTTPMASKHPTRPRSAPRILAAVFTAGSAAWTLYSVWDLLGVGPISIAAGAGAEGLWVGGMLAYRAKPTRLTATAMLAGLAGTLAILAVHGFGTYGWGGIVAVVPPLAAEIFWHVDAQLGADPTGLTPEQQAEVDDVIREARHVTARAAAEQALEDAEHAAKLARIRRDGELRLAEDAADFDVAVSRIDMQREFARRAPLMLTGLQVDDSDDQQDDQYDDHPDDRVMTSVPASRPVRDVVTSAVTPPVMTERQKLAAARRLDRAARKGRPSRPVTIGELQEQLAVSRREAADLRRTVLGE